jgi:hypothetical protein
MKIILKEVIGKFLAVLISAACIRSVLDCSSKPIPPGKIS